MLQENKEIKYVEIKRIVNNNNNNQSLQDFAGLFSDFCGLKITDFAAASLKICVSCFAVKIYHGQHSSNIVITFLTSRTIVGLQIGL